MQNATEQIVDVRLEDTASSSLNASLNSVTSPVPFRALPTILAAVDCCSRCHLRTQILIVDPSDDKSSYCFDCSAHMEGPDEVVAKEALLVALSLSNVTWSVERVSDKTVLEATLQNHGLTKVVIPVRASVLSVVVKKMLDQGTVSMEGARIVLPARVASSPPPPPPPAPPGKTAATSSSCDEVNSSSCGDTVVPSEILPMSGTQCATCSTTIRKLFYDSRENQWFCMRCCWKRTNLCIPVTAYTILELLKLPGEKWTRETLLEGERVRSICHKHKMQELMIPSRCRVRQVLKRLLHDGRVIEVNGILFNASNTGTLIVPPTINGSQEDSSNNIESGVEEDEDDSSTSSASEPERCHLCLISMRKLFVDPADQHRYCMQCGWKRPGEFDKKITSDVILELLAKPDDVWTRTTITSSDHLRLAFRKYDMYGLMTFPRNMLKEVTVRLLIEQKIYELENDHLVLNTGTPPATFKQWNQSHAAMLPPPPPPAPIRPQQANPPPLPRSRTSPMPLPPPSMQHTMPLPPPPPPFHAMMPPPATHQHHLHPSATHVMPQYTMQMMPMYQQPPVQLMYHQPQPQLVQIVQPPPPPPPPAPSGAQPVVYYVMSQQPTEFFY